MKLSEEEKQMHKLNSMVDLVVALIAQFPKADDWVIMAENLYEHIKRKAMSQQGHVATIEKGAGNQPAHPKEANDTDKLRTRDF